jgi:hypothetical protein
MDQPTRVKLRHYRPMKRGVFDRTRLVSGMAARSLVLLLLALSLSFCSLAYASPPDPSWIGDYYDDADYDDVVILITAAPGAPPAALVRGLEPHWTAVWLVAEGDDRLPPAASPSEHPSRGPPLS